MLAIVLGRCCLKKRQAKVSVPTIQTGYTGTHRRQIKNHNIKFFSSGLTRLLNLNLFAGISISNLVRA